MSDGNKRSCTFAQSISWKVQVCLSLYVVMVPLVMKGLIRFIFMSTLSLLRETIKNKIKILVVHYWFTYVTTYLLFELHDMYHYIYNNYCWISILRLNSPPVEYNFYLVVLLNLRVSSFVRFIVASLYKELN